MANSLLKSPAPQAGEIYSLLAKRGSMSAKEIGKHLRIFPNAVYRMTRQLLGLGFVEEIYSYPVKFQAKPANEAITLYTATIKQNFYEMLDLKDSVSSNIKISFFQTRKDLLKLFAKDAAKAKRQINIIVSGHEIPAETTLAYKRAIDHGVKIRKLIQNKDEENIRLAKNWQKMGIGTRYTPLMQARVVIFDGQIIHFGSYDPKRQQESMGVRFDYAPYALMMDELFEQKWQMSKDINGV
jgi:sugar-specific transcriptional regulator TrmB